MELREKENERSSYRKREEKKEGEREIWSPERNQARGKSERGNLRERKRLETKEEKRERERSAAQREKKESGRSRLADSAVICV